MTTVQIASIGTVTITKAPDYQPVATIHEPGLTRVPVWLNSLDIAKMVGDGFAVVDPLHLVTCPGCGALIEVGMMECDGCAGADWDWQDEQQMYADLRGG